MDSPAEGCITSSYFALGPKTVTAIQGAASPWDCAVNQGENEEEKKYQSSLMLLLYKKVVLARESEAGEEELLKQAFCLNRTV